MRVLVTRPEPDATTTSNRLAEAGHEAVCSPLMTISFEPISDLGPELVQAIIVTSRNAVRALAQSPVLPQLLQLPVFAVGPGTTRDAHDLGFHGVMKGTGTAAGLVDVIASHADPEGGRLIHFAGYKLAFDLEGALREKGFTVDTIRCYAAQRAEELAQGAREALQKGHVDAVLLMSPEASKTYTKLVKQAGLEAAAKSVACVCISKATAEALEEFGPELVRVADQPNSEEVLALVNRMAEQSRP